MSKQSDLVSVSQGSGGDPLYIDTTNDNVGIGTSSPNNYSGWTTLTIASPTNGGIIDFEDNGAVCLQLASTTSDTTFNHQQNGYMAFRTNNTERMRIDSSGNLLVGVTNVLDVTASTNVGTSFTSGIIQSSNNNSSTLRLQRTGTDGYIQTFYKNTTFVGSIYTTGSSTSYNTSSDYRLKENVTPLDGAVDRLAQIPVHRFNFIADPDTTVDGFLAHEVQAFVPEAITGEKDAVDVDGNPDYQGIDQSKLVPLLTAALQEALQKIDALEARVATLEGGAA